MAQDGRLVAHLHRIPALVDLIDEDWRHEHLSHDDFDLPSVDFDEDSDDVLTMFAPNPNARRRRNGPSCVWTSFNDHVVAAAECIPECLLCAADTARASPVRVACVGGACAQRIETNLVCP